ncbi:unnamed protein product [Ixodes persulcatus]
MAGYILRARHLKYFYFIAIAGSLFILLRSRAKSVQRSLPVEAPTHKVLIWDVGKRMERRFLRSFGSSNKDPFEFCTVRNCVLETSNDKIGEAAAVFFHLHMTKGPETLPKFHRPDQLWIFFTDESPLHTFMATKKYKMSDYNGIFNLSMTYRSDSDIPAAYGRTVELSEMEKSNMADLPNYATSRNRMVAILGSNCGGPNKRWPYVRELAKHVSVDIYGGCGTKTCPGHFTRDCDVMKDYKFYLAFENSNCREYITEKLWWNAFEKEVLPVVMGGSKEDYSRLCPPHSFIHVEDFEGPRHLAEYLKFLDSNHTAYNSYFAWKKKYRVLNEHGYFGSPSLHLCRICELLNSGRKEARVYDDLESFWNSKTDCRPPVWDGT